MKLYNLVSLITILDYIFENNVIVVSKCYWNELSEVSLNTYGCHNRHSFGWRRLKVSLCGCCFIYKIICCLVAV